MGMMASIGSVTKMKQDNLVRFSVSYESEDVLFNDYMHHYIAVFFGVRVIFLSTSHFESIFRRINKCRSIILVS